MDLQLGGKRALVTGASVGIPRTSTDGCARTPTDAAAVMMRRTISRLIVAEATRMLVKVIHDMEPRQYKKRTLFAKIS